MIINRINLLNDYLLYEKYLDSLLMKKKILPCIYSGVRSPSYLRLFFVKFEILLELVMMPNVFKVQSSSFHLSSPFSLPS